MSAKQRVIDYLQLPTCIECRRTIWVPAFVIHGYRGKRRHIRHLLRSSS